MKRILYSIVIFLFFSITQLRLIAQEEFNGPMPGWANVKIAFGAKGNGKDDDTKAIQKAIDDFAQPLVNYHMRKPERFMVLYFPAGTYCISSALVLKGKIGVSIIGEDPMNTTIKWIGSDANTMLLATGSAYFKVARLTWDANNRNGIEAIGIHWKERVTDIKSQSSAPTSLEISDNIFIGKCKVGIGGGTSGSDGTGAMDSEVTIRRCVFRSCTYAGVCITGFNALDYWIWDCQFIDCLDGINSSYGNYHVYRSYFKGSRLVDLHNTSGYYISARGCFSEGSRAFSYDEGYSTNPFKRIFQGNVILSPAIAPIAYFSLTKMTFIDNQIAAARDSTVKSSVNTGSWGPGNYEVLSLYNRYSYKNPFWFISQPSAVYSAADINTPAAVKLSAAKDFLASMDKTPKAVKRKVFIVPDAANSAQIQQLLNEAAKLHGQRPVVYFASGNYSLEQPLTVPKGADMQICGDGHIDATILQPTASFPKGKALLVVKGPSHIVIRDIQFGRFTNVIKPLDAISFENADQTNSAAYIDQLYSNSHQSIAGMGLDYLRIQETNSFFSDGKNITGGSLMQNGKGTAGLFCFGGQFAGLTVNNRGKAVMKDCWWEGEMRKPLQFTGSGNVTIDGAMVAPRAADSNTTVAIGSFVGKISLLNMYLQGGLSIEPNNPGLNLLFWNIHFYHKLDPLSAVGNTASYKGAFMGITSQCFSSDPKCANIFTIANQFKGGVKLENYLPLMLEDDRASVPAKYTLSDANVSSVFISRIAVGDCNTAIRFSK